MNGARQSDDRDRQIGSATATDDDSAALLPWTAAPEIHVADPSLPDAEADLATLLAAWHGATERLQRTHETLRREVRRLTDELQQKNRELARNNRLADLGQMASHVAHEVRNNLVPVSLYLSLLGRRLSGDPGSLDVLAKVEAGMTALEATVNDLLHFTSDRDPRRQVCRIDLLVRQVIRSLAPQLAAQHIVTELDLPEGLTALVDENMLRRAVLNLTLNAVDAMPDGGELVVTAVQTPRGIDLEIADSGPGLTETVQQRLFEPFFSTKSGGTGLGLAIVQRIAEAHGGEVVAVNCPEGGAALTIHIPRQVVEAAA
jgi:signal transduction histidine kinase